MNKKKEFDFTILSKQYIEKKQKEIKILENRRKQIELEIEKEKKRLEQNNEVQNKLKFDNSLLKDQYVLEKRLLKERGIIFHVINKNYNIKEWDNLYLSKQSGNYIISTKEGEIIKVVDKDKSRIVLQEICQNGEYSLIVVRVDKNDIKIQLRFK